MILFGDPGDEQPARDPEFWDATNAEVLMHTTMDEAIEAALDDMDACDQPDELVVRGMAPMRPSFGVRKATEVCEELLDCLDEEFGDPYSHETQGPTEEMITAANALLNAVLGGYKSWACEEVCSVTVDVKEWIEKNRPDWLDGAAS